MEPEFHFIPLKSSQTDSDEAIMQEMTENSLKYKTFNVNEIKYLYNSLIDNCIYFLETTYESLNNTPYDFSHKEFHHFVENIIRKARVTIPLLYSVMYYIKRFRTSVRNNPDSIRNLQQGITITKPEDLRKIFITATVISLKFFNDRVILNAEWTKFIKLSTEEVSLCERQFFKFINYNLNLNVDNYYIFINDYLTKFHNKSESFPPNTCKSDHFVSSPTKTEDTTATQPITNICNSIPNSNGNQQPNLAVSSTAKAFLSITPTPSVCSQSSPYTTNDPSNNRILTPNDVFIEPQEKNSERVLYNDPIGIEESPIKSISDAGYNSSITRNDTDCTIYNNSNDPAALTYSSYYPLNSPNDENDYNVRTPKNFMCNTLSSATYVQGDNEYHPSEDEVLTIILTIINYH